MILLAILLLTVFLFGSFLVRKIHNKKDPPRLMCPYSKILTLIIIADSGGTSCKQI